MIRAHFRKNLIEIKTAAREETGKYTRGVGADINAVLTKSVHVLGALGAAVMCTDKNSRKAKS
jgi:uncharacterized protein YwbE